MDDIRRQEVRQIAQLTARLDPAQQIFFQAEYSLHRRNPTTAFLLCLLLGDFGAHYFYFGRNRAGVVRLLFCWTLIPAILALFDARTMTARARRYNASLAHELVLAIQGAVEEHATVPDALVEAAPRAPVASGRRPVLAAPISTPEMDAIAAAAWVEREPLQDDPRDPPIVDDQPRALDGLETVWPNALARPVQPERYTPEFAANDANDQMDDPHDAAHEDEAPVWPVPAAWLNGGAPQETFETFESFETLDAPATNGTTNGATNGAWLSQREADDRRDASPFSLPASAAIAAAAASAAAIFAERTTAPGAEPDDDEIALDPLPDPATTMPPADAREPVLLYQVAPLPRRESVRVGPPLPAAYESPAPVDGSSADDPRGTNQASQPGTPADKSAHAGADQVALAALGSALASGLADLLREHPRTRPITRPAAPETLPLDPAPSPHAFSQSANTLLAAAAALPTRDALPVTPPMFPSGALATRADYATAPLVPAERDTAPEPEADPATAHPARADEWPLWLVPLAAPLAIPDVAASTNRVPAPEAPTPVSPAPPLAALAANIRRRVVQRVIVRKMALLDGRVVAEATVERQVPVVRDEAEMAARIRMATRDAAREALGDLLALAPEEARESIREQLQTLQQPTA